MDAITLLETGYEQYPGLCNTIILLLVFGGMARIALALFGAGIHAHRVSGKRRESQRRVREIRGRYTRD